MMKFKPKYLIATILIIGIQVSILTYLGLLVNHKYISSQKTFVTILDKKNLVIDPDSGTKSFWELAPYTRELELFQPFEGKVNTEYQVNSAGFNNLSEFTIDKPANTFRIITLGDSFTFGLFVKTSENYPEVLRSLISKNCLGQKVEVINLGSPMYDARYSFERFRLRGIKYNPDLVVWLLKDDDLNRIQDYLGPKADEYQIKFEKKLNWEVISKGQHDKEAIQEAGELYDKASKEAMKDFNREFTPKQIEDYQLGVLTDYYKIYSGSTVFLTFPFTKKEYKDFLANFSSSRKNTFVLEASDIEKLNQVFPDHHPNVEGHQTIAQDLFNYLIKNNLLPCNN